MNNCIFDEIYKKVPKDQKERLRGFVVHIHKYVMIAGVDWEYISCGRGAEALVLLPGGARFGETWFRLIMALENEYRIISPTYPPATKMAELVDGIAHILESEDIEQAHLLRTSFGGWLAQCFIRKCPEKVDRLILSNTSGPDAISAKLVKDDAPAFRASAREALKTLYPQAQVHTFYNAGHTPGYIRTEEYVSIVRNFLQEK